MPDFLIERVMPGVGGLDVDALKATSRLSWAQMKEEFPAIEWLHSYATDDRLYCLYRAPDEAVVREYARGSTLPVHKIAEVKARIDPRTI